jgi:hypothetical protein
MYNSTLSLTSALDGGWSTSRPGRFIPGEGPWLSFYRRLYGPRSRSGRVQINLPSPGLEHRTVRFVASFCMPADCTFPADDTLQLAVGPMNVSV